MVSDLRAGVKGRWGSRFSFCERFLLVLLLDMTVTTASSSPSAASFNPERRRTFTTFPASALPQPFIFLIRQILHLQILIIFSTFAYSFFLVIPLHFKFILHRRNYSP